MDKPNTDHVVFRTDLKSFLCKHCDASFKPATPVPLIEFVATAKAFTEDHQHCKPQGTEKPMSLLSHNELLEIVRQGVISAEATQVNAASIDVRLGGTVLTEVDTRNRPFVRLADKADGVAWERREIPADGYYLKPGEIILAETIEVFHLPDDLSAEFKLKSSLARSCLDHALAGWCDAGWHGSVLTLELKNTSRYHTLILDAGMKIGQMIFYRHSPVPPHASYAATGRYNQDKSVNASKGLQ